MPRSYASLIAGAVLGLIAIVLMAYYVRSTQITPQQLGPVVVSAADFSTGMPVAAEQLKVAQWPVSAIPDSAFPNVTEVFRGATTPEDRVALKAIRSGEPILRTNISGFGGRATMSREVARGMRAVSLSINDVSGVAGFILPGDHVDVMLTRQADNGGLATDVILQNISVLGIDQLSDQERDKPVVARTVTVEVTTEQAQKLTLAQQAGTLSLALRNAETLDQSTVHRVDVPDLYGNVAPKPHAVHHAAPGIIVRYGDGSSQVSAIAQPAPATAIPGTAPGQPREESPGEYPKKPVVAKGQKNNDDD
jgi:pilus assembly protein CpaB